MADQGAVTGVEGPEWLNRAMPVEALTIEVGFVLADSFYYGPANGLSPQQWEELREPLYRPELERYEGFVLTDALETSVAELVKYYADVLRLLGKHRKDVRRAQSYFWLRPLIFSEGIVDISFPWYDTWEAAECVLDTLGTTACGEIYSDIEQGWELVVCAAPERLFFRETDPDSGVEHCCVSSDRGRLTEQIPSVRARALRVLSQLRSAFGRNYWSRK